MTASIIDRPVAIVIKPIAELRSQALFIAHGHGAYGTLGDGGSADIAPTLHCGDGRRLARNAHARKAGIGGRARVAIVAGGLIR